MFDGGVLWSVSGAKCGNDGLLIVVFWSAENRQVFHVYFLLQSDAFKGIPQGLKPLFSRCSRGGPRLKPWVT